MPLQPAAARETFIDAVSALRDDERAQRDAIQQMLVALMDVTEQSPSGDMVIAAYDAFQAVRREEEKTPPPAPPPVETLPPDKLARLRFRFDVELLANGEAAVWVQADGGAVPARRTVVAGGGLLLRVSQDNQDRITVRATGGEPISVRAGSDTARARER